MQETPRKEEPKGEMRGFIPTFVFIAERVQDEPHEETLRIHLEYKSSGNTSNITNRDLIDYLLSQPSYITIRKIKKWKKSQREQQ